MILVICLCALAVAWLTVGIAAIRTREYTVAAVCALVSIVSVYIAMSVAGVI